MKTLFVLTLSILGLTAYATGTLAPPVANAGADQTIYLTQTSTATLNGSASSGDSYQWTDVSTDYKSGATISSPNSAVTTVTGLKQGTWYYQLAVTSGGVTTTDIVVLRVDYDIPPANGTLLRNLVQNLPSLSAEVNMRTDTTKYFWGNQTSPYTETQWEKGDTTYFLQRDRLNGQFIDALRGKFYTNIEDGYPIGGQGYARSELFYGSDYGLDSNKTYMFEWKGYYPQGFSYLAANKNVTTIMQIHGNDGASPPFEFVMRNNDLTFLELSDGGNGYNMPDHSGTENGIKIASLTDFNSTHTIRLTVREGLGYNSQDAFVKVEVDGVQKYFRNTGRVGSTLQRDYPKFATLYDFNRAIVDPGSKTRGRKFSLVTESFKVYQLTNNQVPQANAGSDQTILLPENTVTLSGSGKDPDGTIKSYQWNQISGPSTAKIANSNSASTGVSGLVQGTYQFELTVTDNNGATGKASMQVTVKNSSNTLPIAKAGSDQSVNLPANTIKLSGSGTDADGTIESYQWTKISGASATIGNPNSGSSTVSDLVAGVYQFELTVTDNQGGVGKDTVSVTVNPASNTSPKANAGSDQTLTLPTNTITLSGSGSDADGSIKGYLWTKVSGPSSYKIVSPGTAVTDITGLVQGTYEFVLTVTDDQGATAKDTVQVIVSAPANISPTADAGEDQTITLPLNSASLTGSGTDPDGSIKAYQWKKISGPTIFDILNSILNITNVSGLVEGTYQFELTVTDNQGATGKDTVQVQVNALSNTSPIADAGSGIVITLPVNTATLTGSGSDADGSIKGYQWKKVSGPSSYKIASPGAAVTDITGLVQGTYEFELTVTDDKGATGKAKVQVQVNAASDTPPTADAGSGIVITLPVNTATLTGSGSDPDGSIKSYQWTKVSGPSSFSISNPATQETDVTGLVQGTYEFELTVTDDKGATGKDTVQVKVNAASNTPPTANAGSKIVITLPVDTATLTGSGSDADGSIKSYQWTKVSGPSSFSIENPATAKTDVTGLVEGTYQFELTVTDDQGMTGKDTVDVQVNAALNIPPTANAGSNKTIALPADTTTLTGSGSDADGTIQSYQWAKISGPSSYKIANAASPVTEISGLVQGIYYFELTVTDDKGAIDKATVQVRVKAASNTPPVADAGPDKTITLPVNSTTLTGSGNDPDGSIKSYKWAKISGPSSYTIAEPKSSVTDISELIEGTYRFELEVTDNSGDADLDTVLVIVKAEPNIAPTADAGTDKTITLPGNTTTLTGSGSDQDGNIKSYQWTKISGPSSYNIANPSSPSTDISGLVQGVYQFELEVTDDKGGTGRDTVQVRVNAASNLPPTANAGSDKIITLPTNLTTLSGSGSDADGSIKSYRWKKISGPTLYNLVNASLPETEVSELAQGTYQFELTVTDNDGATGTDTVQVKVNNASNIPPTAHAGSDRTITLPTSIITLTGSGNDADGTIRSYQWTMISGPGSYNIVNVKSPVTDVSELEPGVYQFELEVTDNDGDTGRDTVKITVNAPSNTAPTANAGSARTITLPTSTVSLTGAGSDADGTIASYQWTKISGPSAYNIVNPASPVTDVSGLVQGVYLFELVVTDDKGAVGKDTVQIRVNAASNIAPTANAGPDKTITLPINSINLTGTGNDPDGNIKSYKWTKLAGPSSFDIGNSTSAVTNITGLVAGIYEFELTVVDNRGDSGQDTVIVKVNAVPDKAPTSNAGSDQSITWPVSSTTLTGSGSDPEGNSMTYQWTKISGPSTYKIESPSSAVTKISAMVQGTYQFELMVTDDKGSADRDTVQVKVNPGQTTSQSTPNIAPIATAGNDTTVVAPVDVVTLTGTAIDPDGSIASYVWTQISGPTASTISPNNTAVTDITNLVEGTYSYELEVTDNKGLKGRDTVNITVALGRIATQLNSIQVYPNPVHDMTTVEINTGKANTNLMIIISDMTGRTVYRKQFVSTRDNVKERINMGYLVKGTYIVTVLFDGMENQSVKVIRM